ncbi:type VII secretion protein EccB [Dactylosporangium sp. NPDC048998]|uniref:type VII secretion protein EccB n=1 Tax=Dactylosporangium sp. NPDC048998 TaxID=3363976 RepID=UPI00371F4A3A
MASRRDQLQSYQFRSQRVVSAFVMRETDPAQSPLRRGGGALLVGGMVAVLVAAAFGVYGILTKIGGSSWKVDGTVVVEKESGATFVYGSGILYPTLNYASALLAAGHGPPIVKQAAANSLAGTPRAAVIGIPGAPNSVPDAKHLTKLPWTVCSARPGNNGDQATAVQLSIAGPGSGARALPADDGILVSDKAGALALIWHGYRYKLDKAVQASLFAAAPVTPVGNALLESLPVGADIRDITVPKAGAQSTAVPDRHNGDVLVAQTGSGPLYYLVFDDGLAPLTELQKDIATKAGGNPKQIDLQTAERTKKSGALPAVTGPQAPPLQPPHLTAPGAGDTVCAEFTADATAPALSIGAAVTAVGVPTRGRTSAGGALADLIAVPAGRAALVVSEPSPGYAIGGWFLITDTGFRYPVVSKEDVQFLGYNPDDADRVPAALLGRIPAGPSLSHASAIGAAPISAK